MLRICLAFLILCISVLYCSGNSNFDYRRPIKVKIDCCESVSKARIKEIATFKRQSAADKCVEAVIFHTKNNGSFCSDPKAKWVRRTIRKMENKGTLVPKGGKKGGRKGGNNQKKKTSNKTNPVSMENLFSCLH
ncbi:C-C motif chemokine 8-like isoform X2 [Pelobates cultripes]|uniref:C-C motif chemokine 8-like isoform X2 n=1 Tax=Pelobates cultripes TaxID=61616 RepID=A0AAD1VRS8_PELCU|nr:C-C motif chemokine 8-like isoform X2 [Pelobates cultripes]